MKSEIHRVWNIVWWESYDQINHYTPSRIWVDTYCQVREWTRGSDLLEQIKNHIWRMINEDGEYGQGISS